MYRSQFTKAAYHLIDRVPTSPDVMEELHIRELYSLVGVLWRLEPSLGITVVDDLMKVVSSFA